MARILRVDTTWEVLTTAAWTLRTSLVYPQFLQDGHELIPRLEDGTIASRSAVESFASDPSIRLITASGHGKADRFQGDYDENIFPEGLYDPREVSGKIIHFLACATAADLGPNFVSNGCRAFIGYNVPFVYETAWAPVFFQCDAQIDIVLSLGGSVADALSQTRQHFDAAIANPNNSVIANQLIARRDSLVALGPNLQIGING